MSGVNIKKNDTMQNIVSAEKVFEKHADFIRSVISFHVKNEAEAEDLFQNIFLVLIMKPLPDDLRNIRGFLYKIITDKIKDFVRQTVRYKKRIYNSIENSRNSTVDSPERAIIDLEETQKMFDVIRKNLPDKEALAVKLRYLDGYDISETASVMEVKPRTVSRYVSIGLKKLSHIFIDKSEE